MHDCLATIESHGVPPNIYCCGNAVQLVHRRYSPANKRLVIQYKTESGLPGNHYSSESDDEDFGNSLQQFGKSMPSIGSVPIEPHQPTERKRSISSSYETNSYLSSSMNRSQRGGFMNPGFMLSSSPTTGLRANFGGLSKSASLHTGPLTGSRSFSHLDSTARNQFKSGQEYCPEKSIQLNILSQKWAESCAIDIEASTQHDDMPEQDKEVQGSNVSAKCYRMLRPRMYILEIGHSQISSFSSDRMIDHMNSSVNGETIMSANSVDAPEVTTISITLGSKSSTDSTANEQHVFLNGKEVIVLDYIGQNRRWSKSESGTFRGTSYFDIDGDVFGDIMDIHDEEMSTTNNYSDNTAIAKKEELPMRKQDQKNILSSQTSEEPTEPLSVQEPLPLVNAHNTFFKVVDQENSNNFVQNTSAAVNELISYERDLADGTKAAITESLWENCSIWDVKAIIDCPGITAKCTFIFSSLFIC
jgi:hypothetical protein